MKNIIEKIKNSSYCLLFIIPLILGIILDLAICKKPLIFVSTDYLNYIYTAIITISTISFTFITILIGLFNESYYGFKFKDIMNFKNNNMNFKIFINIFALHNLSGLLFFALSNKYCTINTSTAILISLILYECWFGKNIYDFIGNHYEVIGKSLACIRYDNKNGCVLYKQDAVKLLSSLKEAIDEIDEQKKNETLGLLKRLNMVALEKKDEGEVNYKQYMNDILFNVTEELTYSFGYIGMIRDLIYFFGDNQEESHIFEDILLEPVKNIRFYNSKDIIKKIYLQEIINIFYDEDLKKKVPDRLISNILFFYLQGILKNKNLSEREQQELCAVYMQQVTKFYSGNADAFYLLNFYILKYFILNSEDKEERNKIFNLWIRNIFLNNKYSDNENYFKLVGLYAQSFYAYVYLETEFLSIEDRKELSDLITEDTNEKSIGCQITIIKRDIGKILKCLCGSVFESKDDMEKQVPYMIVRNVIWSTEFNITFTLMLYIIFNQEVYLRSYLNLFEFDKLDSTSQKSIVDISFSKFDICTKTLTTAFMSRCNDLACLFKVEFNPILAVQKRIFDELNNKKSQLIITECKNEINIVKDKDIINCVNEKLEKDGVLGYNCNESYDIKKTLTLNYGVIKDNQLTPNSVAFDIIFYTMDFIEYYIKNNANKIVVSVEPSDIDNFLTQLDETKLKDRNFLISSKFLSLGITENNIHDKIEMIERKIEFVDTPKVNLPLVFDKDAFKFSINSILLEKTNLNDEEVLEYVEKLPQSNGRYIIEAVLMNKEDSIKFISKNYIKAKLKFSIEIDEKVKHITYLDFKYRWDDE